MIDQEGERLAQPSGTPMSSTGEPMAKTPPARGAEPRPVELAAIFAAHHQRVATWVRCLGGAGIEVDDAVQEVFLVAHRRLRWFRLPKGLTVWLYRVTENVVARQRRRLRRYRSVLSAAQHDLESLGIASEPFTSASEEGEQATLELVYQVLDRMSERGRTLIILFELEEMSGQDIAALKGAKLATIWVWLYRARAEFQQQLTALRREM